MNPLVALAAAQQWIAIGTQVFNGGSQLFGQIKQLLAANNIQADMSALEEVIADCDRRKAMAEAEAQSQQ